MSTETLSLALVAENPSIIAQSLVLPNGEPILYRPLLPEDVALLAEFLESLSAETRHFWDMASYDRTAAEELCFAINRYDKLRMVALSSAGNEAKIVGLFEFSLDLTDDDCERYHSYGITLKREKTCRFGPCIRDTYQNSGLGSILMQPTFRIAEQFGKRCIILWGGVLQENRRAIHFYKKHGFRLAGAFVEPQGIPSYDMLREI